MKTGSRLDTIYLCATLWGMGMLCGFGVFLSLWQDRCVQVVSETRNQCQTRYQEASAVKDLVAEKLSAQNSMALRYDELMQTHQELTRTHQELTRKHEELSRNHEELVRTHEATQTQVQALERQVEASSRQQQQQPTADKDEQVRRLQRELLQAASQSQSARKQCDRQVEGLHHQLQISRSMIKQRVYEHMKQTSCEQIQEQYWELAATMQSQSRNELVDLYGEGPYMVEMELETVHDGITSLRFELDKTMPHTVRTFLSLVEDGRYVGKKVDVRDGMSVIGEAVEGVQITPFLIDEAPSSDDCDHSSIGLTGHGDQIVIYKSHHEGCSAFGRLASSEQPIGDEVVERRVHALRVVTRQETHSEL